MKLSTLICAWSIILSILGFILIVFLVNLFFFSFIVASWILIPFGFWFDQKESKEQKGGDRKE